MDVIIDFIVKCHMLLLIVVLVVVANIVFKVLKWYLGTSMRHKIFLCVDYFVRNSHEQNFYMPPHTGYSEYMTLFKELNREKNAWYYS